MNRVNRRICALLLGLAVLSLPASSMAAAARTKSGSYNTVVGEVNANDPSPEGAFSNSVTFRPRAGEGSVSVRIQDKSGLPTRALVVQSRTGPRGPYRVLEREICGRTKTPIKITKGLDVSVVVQDGPCADGTAAAATFGTVTATFE